MMGAGLALAGTVFAAQHAEAAREQAAELSPYRWVDPVVCVQDLTDRPGQWPVSEAVRRVDSVPHLRIVWSPTCDGHAQVVEVYEGWYPDDSWYGLATVWRTDGRITAAVVELNNSHAHQLTGERDRLWVVVHELLHAIGLGHSHRDSAMNGHQRRTAPTAVDRANIGRLYAS